MVCVLGGEKTPLLSLFLGEEGRARLPCLPLDEPALGVFLSQARPLVCGVLGGGFIVLGIAW